jgi:hypothetical protein
MDQPMTEKHDPKMFAYGIIAFNAEGEVIHLVTFEEEPTYRSYLNLICELKTDIAFDMIDMEFGFDYNLEPAPQWILADAIKRLDEGDPNLTCTVHDPNVPDD